MQVAATGVIWMWLMLAGAGAMPPLGPPLPLDPTLSKIAPEDCLWYAASAGIGKPDANSSNETEQLFAEPQVQRFVQEIETQIMAALRRAGGPNRAQRVAAAELPKIVKALLTRPIAAYIEEIQPGDNKSVKAEAAFVLNAGEQREELSSAIQELLDVAREGGLQISAASADGVEWERVATPPQAPAVHFGWKDEYFVVAVGDETPARLVARMNAEVRANRAGPEWLKQIRDEHPIQREMAVGYLNVAGILERIKPLMDAHHPEAWTVIERIGLTAIRGLHGVAGFDDVGCTSVAHLVVDGQRPGLLGFLPHEALTAADVAIVPKDALLAGACRIDASDVLQKGLAMAGQFDQQAKEKFEGGLWQVEAHLGVNVRDEIVAPLGDVWVAYLPGGDLMSSWLNSAAAVRVDDADKLRGAMSKLMERAKSEMARSGDQVSIGESKVGEQTLYSLQFQGQPIPISPSWCVSDDWVIFGLLPQAVQSALDRQAEDSLAEAPPVREAIDQGAAALYYQDTPQLVRSAFPLLQMGVQMLSAQLRQQGISIDTTALPAAETVVKHLRPTVSTISHADDGFHVTTRGSLPGGGNMVGAAPILVALGLPAVQKARSAARDVQELNNLKQLALAFLNYESAKGQFPTDVYSNDGKPLLSWRVQLLPFMEEMALYNQFHLDEPWDSEHNRPLLDRMPVVLRSPSSPELGQRTRFLALKGSETLFPGNERLSFRHVVDGTSNTILFVEASPDAAIEWTRPADIDFDASKPLAGLAQPNGYFLAVFNDGATRRLSLSIGADTIKALATRGGGEVVDHDALQAPPAPWLYRADEPGAVQPPAGAQRW